MTKTAQVLKSSTQVIKKVFDPKNPNSSSYADVVQNKPANTGQANQPEAVPNDYVLVDDATSEEEYEKVELPSCKVEEEKTQDPQQDEADEECEDQPNYMETAEDQEEDSNDNGFVITSSRRLTK